MRPDQSESSPYPIDMYRSSEVNEQRIILENPDLKV